MRAGRRLGRVVLEGREHTGIVAVGVLRIVAFRYCRIVIERPLLVTFNIHANQSVTVERNFAHPFWIQVKVDLCLDIWLVRMFVLVDCSVRSSFWVDQCFRQ